MKYNGKDRNGDLRRIQLLIAAAAAVIGGAGGWFAAIRTEAVQDQMRLLLVMMALCAAAGVDLLVRCRSCFWQALRCARPLILSCVRIGRRGCCFQACWAAQGSLLCWGCAA